MMHSAAERSTERLDSARRSLTPVRNQMLVLVLRLRQGFSGHVVVVLK
jgi:hypothetical protein